VRRGSNITFGVLLVTVLAALLWIVRPFLVPALLGAFAAVLFHPLHDALARRLGRAGPLSAGLATLAVFLLGVLPLSGLVALVARELARVAEELARSLQGQDLLEAARARIPAVLQPFLPAGSLAEQTRGGVSSALGAAAGLVSRLLGQGLRWALQLFLLLVSLYYFFLDGRRMLSEVLALIPTEHRYKVRFAQEFRDVSWALAWGHGGTALLQAVLGTVGLALAKVSAPLVWGTAMLVTALVPVGGTALVWLPVGVGLLLTGRVGAGLFVLAWGTVLVSTVDNVVRPRLMGARMHLHPLVTFFCLFGGLAVLGPVGLLVGPLVGALAVAGLSLYREDFLPSLVPPE
jgi:predicted PurR-regulated permease PerM